MTNLSKYSKEQLMNALSRLEKKYPAVFKHFVLYALENFSPFDRTGMQYVSPEDLEYLKGEPAPLKITIPIKIEK